MSDPAQSPEEIEDVLASIRRLVSDHGGSTAAPSGVAQTAPRPESAVLSGEARIAARAQAAPKATDALVLTPSFRVADPDDPWVPVSATAESDAEDELAEELAVALISDGVSADGADAAAAPAMRERGADWQPDDRLARFDIVGGEDGPLDGIEDADDTEMQGTDADAGTHAGTDAGTETASRTAEQPDLAVADRDGPGMASGDAEPGEGLAEADLADLTHLDGAVFDDVAAEFESDTGDENWPGDGAEAALLSLVARRDPAADETGGGALDAAFSEDTGDVGAGPDDAGDVGAGPDDAGDVGAGIVSGAHDTLRAHEISDAPTALEAEPAFAPEADMHAAHHRDAGADGADADGHRMHTTAQNVSEDDDEVSDIPPPIFSRRGQADVSEETETSGRHEAPMGAAADVEDLGAEAFPFSFPDPEDGILDEDTLREIIVDVVREELQGVLGQRITRNVRKMVRREIRLALAAEDLE